MVIISLTVILTDAWLEDLSKYLVYNFSEKNTFYKYKFINLLFFIYLHRCVLHFFFQFFQFFSAILADKVKITFASIEKFSKYVKSNIEDDIYPVDYKNHFIKCHIYFQPFMPQMHYKMTHFKRMGGKYSTFYFSSI